MDLEGGILNAAGLPDGDFDGVAINAVVANIGVYIRSDPSHCSI